MSFTNQFPSLLDRLQSRCTASSLKLDIGANDGGYTHLMREKGGTVHAFEPLPDLYQITAARFADDPHVEVFHAGVSNQEHLDSGFQVFEAWTLDKAHRATRGRNAEATQRYGETTHAIQFVTVDGHCSRVWKATTMGLDFLKIDTDGYEFRVLQGAATMLAVYRPPIYFELNYMVNDIGDNVHEMLALIYDRLHYTIVTDQGEVRDAPWWLDHWPWHTTFDVALIPRERLGEFGVVED